MSLRRYGWLGFVLLSISTSGFFKSHAANVESPFGKVLAIPQDTFPIQDRFGDFVTEDYYNPFDIQSSEIVQTVEYDIETEQYLILEKIGDEFYRMPIYLTMEEYLEYTRKKQEREQFLNLAGVQLNKVSFNTETDPLLRFDLEDQLTDRLFGGVDVDIKPTGLIDLTFGIDYQKIENPTLTPRQQSGGGGVPFDFDIDINAGVDGQIGEKLNLDFDYNTLATFDFDNTLNFGYNSEDFDEDDIIKRVEAGNVSLPLRSQLITGSQDLFGLLTELQFGPFRITGIAAQSRSEQESIQIENGNLIQEFEIRPDEYDENRHFFISHYNRDQYENALENIPQIKSQFRITNIEVWVTNDQNSDLQNATTVAAISYFGESEIKKFSDQNTRFPPLPPNTDLRDLEGNTLPDNRNSDLFRRLVNDDATRSIVNAPTRLKQVYGMTQVRDFEVQTMRKLRSTEFTYYPQLGFISLNVRLRPNQVLGVAYEFTYSFNGDEIYKVGELSNESNAGGLNEQNAPEPEDVIYVKMLKSSNQRIDLPSWDLMMKNVYGLPTAQLNEQDFKFDIFFEDFSTNTLKRFIPEPSVRNTPLMNLFRLDQLNSQGDPQQDGIFDFVPGITVNSRTGSIIFPVLEPFGQSLLNLLDGSQELFDKYGFPELYNNSITAAQQALDNNRFVMKGEFKSNISSEISLGAFNIPPGSVTVRAGSQILVEGVDYEIDYGIGRVKILNDGYLQQGVPINVSFEDKSLFNLQQRTMFGLRGDYQIGKKINWGFTYMRLFERPFSQKVNFGNDPINNRMFGTDIAFTTEAPFITKALDKLPLISTKENSSISFTGEVAAIKPGHSKAINVPNDMGAVVSLDDFEGAGSAFPLGSQPNSWVLASTPLRPEGLSFRFPEAQLTNNLAYGVNRALLNWYQIRDFQVRTPGIDDQDSYTRRVLQTELFNRDIDISQVPDLLTFDLTYYPDERGPYNFDPPQGIPGISAGGEYDNLTNTVKLRNPKERWGGIMRYLPNNDFQAANYQYVEFWMLNPFMDRRDNPDSHPPNEEGHIYINLGSVSEDVLKDNLQFYENSIPVPGERIPLRETAWGKVPLSIPNVQGFNQQNIEIQDLGFDGIGDGEEADIHRDYLAAYSNLIGNDPSNDNFVAYLNEEIYPRGTDLLTRFKRNNHPESNVPTPSNRVRIGNPYPDTEDLNDNRSLEQNESYYEYDITIRNNAGEIDVNAAQYVTDQRSIPGPNGDEIWYRFRVPIAEGRPINDIQGFRSIQFIRLYMTGFKTQKTFRLAEFDLVRNQWRTTEPIICNSDAISELSFVVDEIGFQENGDKLPFNYVLPEGIKQERFYNTFSNVLQDEKSLNLRVCDLPDSCEVSINKLQDLDLRQFKRLQMFVHAEEEENAEPLEDGETMIYLRIGKDFNNNYYEYEIPLTFSRVERLPGSKSADPTRYESEVWRDENMFDFPLTVFTDVKKMRNEGNTPLTELFSVSVASLLDSVPNPAARVSIKGNPSLGFAKSMMIGIRNPEGGAPFICVNVWVNELRLNGFNEQGGFAGLARLDIQLADLGNFTASGSYSSVGFGQIDEQIADRNLDQFIDYDFATSLELGKLFPEKWGLTIPFYYQYAKSIVKSKFDQYELDLTVDEMLQNPNLTDEERADIKDRNSETTTIKTINLTNVRKARSSARDEKRAAKGKGPRKPQPWDISNVSLSYSYTETKYKDDIIKEEVVKDHRGSLDYAFSKSPGYVQPFKKLKAKPLRFIKEFSFNLLPNSFSFNTEMRRLLGKKLYRVPDVNEGFEYFFNDQRFNWTRNYALQWDLSKSLRLSYDASAVAVIDEIRQVGVAASRDDRNWNDGFGNEFDENGISYTDQVANNPNLPNEIIRNNIRDFGRMKNFNQGISVNYTLPFKYLPGLDWITMRAQYDGDYIWTAGSLLLNNPQDQVDEIVGNIIQNNQRRAINSTFAFDKLYDKLPYFKTVNKKPRRTSTRRRAGSPKPANNDRVSSRKKQREASTFEKIFVRPLLAMREFKFTYSEDLSTVIPGFLEQPKYFGVSGDRAPGYDFTFGLQPDLNTFLTKAAANGWMSQSPFQSQQVIQSNSQNYEGKIELEPWPDLNIDVDFRKTFTTTHAEDFLYKPDEQAFQRLGRRDFGSYELTYWTIQTLFHGDIEDLFRQFEKNRITISDRLRVENPNLPGQISPNQPHDKDGPLFVQGYGRQNQQVLIPAFIAAYTGQDPELVNLQNITDQIAKRSFIPKPTWELRYNGFNKLPGFKDIFSSMSITHGYHSTLQVNSFQTDLQFDDADPFFLDPLVSSKNFFSRYEIPELVISEQFVPIFGIDLKTHNDINISAEFAKTRNLQLSMGLGQLTEGKSTEYTFGFGWTLENVNIGFLTGRKIKIPSVKVGVDQDGIRQGEEEQPAPENQRGVNNEQNAMNITLNLSWRDDVTFIHEFDSGASSQATRGLRSLQISPALEYDINKNFTLRAFVDYTKTKPYLSTSFPVTSVRGGLTARFNLN